jgi:NADH:ubiquinone oxidoreductase subunit 6 (subunit J)
MTTESVLFLLVGAVAVFAAAGMLTMRNAVHSALLLVVNFACVAFLYLMLNAPFLAMVQIAVYAGAIMVLFLFVIMLLGSEKLSQGKQLFRGYWVLAGVLGVVFFVAAYIAVNGKVDLLGPTNGQATLRVVHAVPGVDAVDVYANNQLIGSNLRFRESSEFKALPSGDYTLNLTVPGTQDAVLTGNLKLEFKADQSNAYTAVAYFGAEGMAVAQLADDLSTTPERSARIRVFNAYSKPADLVDFGSDFDLNDTKVLLSQIEPGKQADLPALKEGTSARSWAFTDVGEPSRNLVSFRNSSSLNIERDTAKLVVLMGEQLFDGSVRPVAVTLASRAQSSFGGPHSVGELLFTRYMLPFQLVAILLLVAMIGAIVLTHKETDAPPRRRDVRRKVSQPLTQVISSQVGQDVTTPPAPRLPEQQPSGD